MNDPRFTEFLERLKRDVPYGHLNPLIDCLKEIADDLLKKDAANERADSVEAVLRHVLMNEIRRLDKLIRQANVVCRSAHEIAMRNGADTNWVTFATSLGAALKAQHDFMYPKEDADSEQQPQNPWARVPKQYAGRWDSYYDEKNSTFFVHCSGHRICDAEDIEVCEAICRAHNAFNSKQQHPAETPKEK
jgi:hypothetical protein